MPTGGPASSPARFANEPGNRASCATATAPRCVDWTKQALAEARIGEEAREQILYRNAAAILARSATIALREQAAA